MPEWLAFRSQARGRAFADALGAFKGAVPSTSRRWESAHGYWVFDPRFSAEVAAIGEVKGAIGVAEDDHRYGRKSVGADEHLDSALIDSLFGDRVLFTAQLTLAEGGPIEPHYLVRIVVNTTDQSEPHVRDVLREHAGRFKRLRDGRIDLSGEAPR